MAQKIYHVFVSSTYSDLKDERKKVSEAVAKAGHVPEGMELFPASSQKQFEFIKRVIDRCDYYVVIIGARYGSIADGDVSYTEKEYEYALSRGIPTLAFLHRNPEQISSSKTDGDASHALKLSAFRTKLSAGAMVDFWDNPADLATSVVISLGQEINLNPGVGWVRGDQAVDPKVFEELSAAKSRVNELQIQLSNAISEEITFPRSIASIDSEFEIVFSVEHYERPGEEKDYKVSSEEVGLKLSTTWRECFLSLQSQIHRKLHETRFRMELPEQISLARGLERRNPTLPSFNIYSLESPTIDKFRHQFEALGLIFADYLPVDDKRSDFLWLLTEKGRKFLAQSLAEKAPEVS